MSKVNYQSNKETLETLKKVNQKNEHMKVLREKI